MRRTLAMLAALAALTIPGTADAHKSFCHHGSVSWSVWSYGQQINYIELWKYGYQSQGVHIHVYWTTYNQGKFLHEHHRACGGTHS